MTRIYTRTGDEGKTALFGGGRVAKSDIRVEAYGSVDELNSVLGWAMTQLAIELQPRLEQVQADLFTIGAILATPEERTRGRRPKVPTLPEERVEELEHWIDEMDAELPELRTFILPGGSPAGAAVHVARTVCRRAERRVVALTAEESIAAVIVTYLNRLSDLLFVLARSVNQKSNAPERAWLPPEHT
jgi:cob(I)alamin adenosyltransferase